MKLTSDNDTLAENKVLILYILDKINKPISNSNLYKLVLSIYEINYFYFQQFLLDLLAQKYVITFEENGFSLYELTKKGKETLSLTLDLLPGILKLKVDNNVKENLETINDANAVISEYMPLESGGFNVTCRIIENNSILFEVTTYAGTLEQAKLIKENWDKNAAEIYPNMLDSLCKVT